MSELREYQKQALAQLGWDKVCTSPVTCQTSTSKLDPGYGLDLPGRTWREILDMEPCTSGKYRLVCALNGVQYTENLSLGEKVQFLLEHPVDLDLYIPLIYVLESNNVKDALWVLEGLSCDSEFYFALNSLLLARFVESDYAGGAGQGRHNVLKDILSYTLEQLETMLKDEFYLD